jgi:mono/diheme cytochrome c family protein
MINPCQTVSAFPKVKMNGWKNIAASLTIGMLNVVLPPAAFGQDIGDPQKGFKYARDVCSPCHAIAAEQPDSPVAEAPRFEDIANTSGRTATAIIAWFQTSHPTMPNVILTDEQTRDIVQYILSLKGE